MVTKEVGRVEAKSEKAELVPRWHGHRERCRTLVSTILLFFNFAAKLCSMKAWADAQYAKHLKVQLLRLKAGVEGGGGTQASLTL